MSIVRYYQQWDKPIQTSIQRNPEYFIGKPVAAKFSG